MPSSLRDPAAFSVTTFRDAEAEDRAYWHALSPRERLVALETMRQAAYAYDPVADRLQRTVEVVERA